MSIERKMKKEKTKIISATLKEAVQGRDGSTNSTVLGIDIDDFKHSLDLFKYSLDYAEAIVNTVREPLVVLNKDLMVITANKAFYKSFNLIPKKIENRPFYELGDGELNIPKLRALLRRVLLKESSFEDFEIEYHIPRKGKRILLLNARKFYRQVNNTQTILLAIEDVTKERNYEKQKDEFALIIMHELKTPVSTISGYTHLLQSHLSERGDEKLIEYADTINEQVRRLTSLINGLLNSSKIRAIGFDYKEEIFDINELIEETIRDVQKTTKTHLITQKNAKAKFIKGDRLRLAQVLINLLTNAIKYSPNSTSVLVETSFKAGKVVIGVKDFGIGISKRNQTKIFKRFFRVNDSSKEPYLGVGLGLDISAQIIRHHKGKMWIDSEVGEGTLFNFSLPTNVN